MMNHAVVVGRILKMLEVRGTTHMLIQTRHQKVYVVAGDTLSRPLNKYCREGDEIGVVGSLSNHRGKVCVIATRITFGRKKDGRNVRENR